MTETILPGVQIEVRPEGLIVPGAVNIGTIGIVGTAANGPIGTPRLLGSYTEAQQTFGAYDRWIDGSSGELTLVRALEQVYRFGATSVYAVRVADGSQVVASAVLSSASGDCVAVRARHPGTVGNSLRVKVESADGNALVRDEELAGANLAHTPVVQSAQNRVVIRPSGGGADSVPTIVYGTAAGPGQVAIDTVSGAVVFATPPAAGDRVLVTYTVDRGSAVKVTVGDGSAAETYNVVSGDDLIADLQRGSTLAIGTPLVNSGELPDVTTPGQDIPLVGGSNGAAGATVGTYQPGLDMLENVDAHIILAAGLGLDAGDELAAHVERASGDEIQRERIALVGSDQAATIDELSSHTLNSDRVILVGPGIKANDNSQSPSVEVDLTGAYAAAAVAGKLSSLRAHISPTNKVLNVGGLERIFTRSELALLVQSRVLVLESRQGFRITKGITTSTNTAWTQVTTRRIVDFAKFGVRSAATPYIGLLNNVRVRAAMRATINSFLATMVDDEMLVSYELDVSATRDEEIRGIARVELVLRPTFSIDFIKVTMFLA